MYEDSQSFSITIPGKPIPKARPRFCRMGSHVKTFDSQSESNKIIRMLIRQQMGNRLPLEGALEVDAVFFMPIPKGTSKKKSGLMRSGEIKHVKRGDIDNYLKAVMDNMLAIVYNDDSQIYKLSGIKKYDTNPRTEITIKWQESHPDSDSENGQR